LIDSLACLKKVSSGFRPFLTNIKLAEIQYRQDKISETLHSVEKAQGAGYGSDADVQTLETLRGKCLDRLKRFPEAISAYQSALVVAVGAGASTSN
jgi:predicted negative regulator of RcsB-dependent stress response